MKRFTKTRADRVLTIGLGLLFLSAGVYAAFLPWQAAILPVMLALSGVALAAALLRQMAQRDDKPSPAFSPDDIATYLWYCGATGAVLLCGFEIGGFLFAFAFFRWSAGFGWATTALLAAPVPLAAFLAFDMLLGRPGFDGLLGWLLI